MAERRIADRHVLDVSDQVHTSIVDMADAARQGREVHAAVVDPITAALVRNARAMIDVDYAGSPLVADHGTGGATAGPHPGQRYPDWTRSAERRTTCWCLAPSPRRVARATGPTLVQARADLSQPGVDPGRAGCPAGGVIMVRPDGHIGFRFPSAEAEAFDGARPPPLLVSDSGRAGSHAPGVIVRSYLPCAMIAVLQPSESCAACDCMHCCIFA